MLAITSHTVEGHVSRGFGAVREAFAENFPGVVSWMAPTRRVNRSIDREVRSREASRRSGLLVLSSMVPARAAPPNAGRLRIPLP